MGDVLVQKDRIAIGIHDDQARGTRRGFVRPGRGFDSRGDEPALQFADVGEVLEGLRLVVPAGVEGQQVPLEHSLEQPDGGGPVLCWRLV